MKRDALKVDFFDFSTNGMRRTNGNFKPCCWTCFRAGRRVSAAPILAVLMI